MPYRNNMFRLENSTQQYKYSTRIYTLTFDSKSPNYAIVGFLSDLPRPDLYKHAYIYLATGYLCTNVIIHEIDYVFPEPMRSHLT